MTIEVDTRVSISLHPQNVEALEAYDEDTASVLEPVAAAFQRVYEGLGSVHTAREKAAANPSWTTAQQITKTADMADKVFASVAATMDSQLASLNKGIAFLEKEMTTKVELRQAHPLSVEIRKHCASLPSAKRMGFIKNAIDAGDTVTSEAILSGPSYLAGIDDNTHSVLTRLWREKSQPQMAKRLKALQQARDLVHKNGGLIHGQLEAAVGARPDQVQKLRRANSEAEAALILKH